MLARATRLLARLRHANPLPPRRWCDELRDTGVSAGDWVSARSASSRLYVGLPEEKVRRLVTTYPDLVTATVRAADRVLRHEFDLLGSGPFTPLDPDRRPGDGGYRPIDWYLDPIQGLRFPRGIPRDTFNLETMRPERADIKLPWELARCQHWPLLGQAYCLTGDRRYAEEIARELDDFMEANPIGTAVNWSCTMDVALRAANWALALELIRSCIMPPAFWETAYQALFDHGVFIEGHLENTYEVTSNHFLSNVVGLFYVAAVFRDLPQGQAWDRQCRTWLETELAVQVLSDGADYESSVPYHRLVTELFLGAARVADVSGAPLPSGMLVRLRSMVDFLLAVLRPDGLMPQVGDADDGRLHVLSAYGEWNPQDARHLLGPAGCLFHNAGWMAIAGRTGRWEAEWWGLDPSSLLEAENPPQPTLQHFPQAGLTVMRRDRDYLLVTNGRVGTNGFGNHKHNDLLAFEYHVDGEPIIVDAGSYVYTPDPSARNLFRSTAYHNTVVVDGEEQNELNAEMLFRMFEKASPEHLIAVDRGDTLEYRGRHKGYTRLREPVLHERVFIWQRSKRTLEITDAFDGTGQHRLRWHFHFAPGVTVELREPGEFDVRSPRGLLHMTAPSTLHPSIGPGWYSPSYGIREPCLVLEIDGLEPLASRRAFTFLITG
jgi:hypothetical protein